METPPSPPQVFARALFTDRAVFWSTLLGGPLAGTFLLAQNFSHMGRTHAARRTLGWGVAAFTVFLPFQMLLAERLSSRLLPYLLISFWVIAAQYLFARYQEDAVEQHLNVGGAKTSGWTALGFSVLGLIVTLWLAVLFSTIITLGSEASGREEALARNETYFGGKQIHTVEGGGALSYDGSVTGEQAAHVGKILRVVGCWQQNPPPRALLSGGGEQYSLLLDINPQLWDAPWVLDLTWSLGVDLPRYFGKPVVVNAIDLTVEGEVIRNTFPLPDAVP